LPLFLFDLFGSASIGVYSLVTDKMVIFPPQFPETKAREVGEWLKVKVVSTTIGKSVLIGALACANSKGMVLSPLLRKKKSKLLNQPQTLTSLL